ncbi:MAG: response regulator [Planctomycetota bacterium]|nr:response regulator [Planctomycetota bacterium]MDA1213097.1 response regulator [Planctomycetota bacterium]
MSHQHWTQADSTPDYEVIKEVIGRPMELLLIEDSLTSARLLMGVLKKQKLQHRLTWLTDGNEATEFLWRRGKFCKAPRPDLVMLDLGLPGKDGREILTELRQDEELRSLPVVVMTSSTDETDRMRSLSLEVEAYLIKPIDVKNFGKLLIGLKNFWQNDQVQPMLNGLYELPGI